MRYQDIGSKILFVTLGCFSSHATLKRATGMAEPLIARGFEVYIIIKDTEINRRKLEQECPNAIPFFFDNLSALRERKYKQRIIREICPDYVWICGMALRNFVAFALRKGTSIVEVSELYSSIGNNYLKRFLYFIQEILIVTLYDKQICASKYLFQRFKRISNNIQRKKCPLYLPYANCLHSFRREEPFISKEMKEIVYMGGLWKNYGIWDILRAVEILVSRRNDFELIVIGKGPEENSIKEWITNKNLGNHVNVVGFIDESEVQEYFESAFMFLAPLNNTVQDWARCPSKLYMYISYGRPVVTCKIGEAIEIYGENGIYYLPGDIQSLANSINNVLDNRHTDYLPDPNEHSYEERAAKFLNWLLEPEKGK